MTSEIRTNSLTSRAGLSTVTLTDSGPMFSGITTFVDNSTFSVGTGGTIHAPATNTLNIGVNNTESLRIDSNSNVKIAGVCTATHFYGNGANLTGISAGTALSGSTNNTVCTVTGANAIQGEANLLFDGGTLALNGRYQRGSATVQDGDAIAGGININGTDMDASVIMSVFGNDGDFTRISGSKSRNASVGSHTIVQNNDVLLSLKGFGSDGTNFEEAAQIEMQVDGTPNNNVMPGRIVFKTTTTDGVAERLRITSTGAINCGHGSAVNLHGSTTTGINLNANNNSGQILANASGNRALIIGRQASYGQVIEFFQGSNTNEAGITIPAADTLGVETNGTERLRIKSNGAIALPDGTQGIRFGSAASEDFAIFHSGSNSHIDHFGTGNLYHDFSNDFYMRFYQSAGVVRTALIVTNGGSGNPEFQLRSNPTSAPTNSGTNSPAVKLRGAGWNTSSGSQEVGTRLESVHSYWQSSFANVFGQTYPDFQIQYKNSDSGSYVAKVNIDGRAGMMMSSSGGAGFGFGNFSSRAYYARMTEYFGAAQDVGLNFWTTTNAGGSLVNHFRIDHNGDLKGTDTSISSISDSRVKKDVVDYTYDLSKFKLFTPKQFNWINPEMHGDKSNVKGFLAQDLEAIDTQWVGESFISKDDPDCELVDKSKNSIDEEVGVLKTSKFGDKDAMYISIIQQVLTKVETLEQENIALRARVTNLEGN